MAVFNTREAIIESLRGSDLNLRERLRIRVALRIPRLREQIEETVQAMCVEEGYVHEGRVQAAVDWSQVLQFIRQLLPIIMELISAFR